MGFAQKFAQIDQLLDLARPQIEEQHRRDREFAAVRLAAAEQDYADNPDRAHWERLQRVEEANARLLGESN